MKIREIYNSKIAAWLGVGGITIAPYVFYGGVPDIDVRVHEMVHIRQVQRLGWLKFYFLYGWEYLRNRLRGMGHNTAYLQISFEIEAYAQQEKFKKWYEGLSPEMRSGCDVNFAKYGPAIWA